MPRMLRRARLWAVTVARNSRYLTWTPEPPPDPGDVPAGAILDSDDEPILDSSGDYLTET